jgi:integrase
LRRKNGEGSIFFREDKGLWCAKVDVGYKTRTIYSKDQQKLLEKKRDLEAAVTTGTYIEPSRTTVEQFMINWLEDVCVPSLSPHTIKRYRNIITLHINPFIGSTLIQKLTPMHLQNLYSQELKNGQSPRSVQQLHAVLHRALFQASKWEYVNRNVADLVQAPKPRKREFQVLNKQQVKKFLEAALNDWYYPLHVLAITTGMRQGELLGLKWDDIDLAAGILTVRRALKEVNGDLLIGDVKSSYSRRVINIPEFSIRTLEKHRSNQNELGLTQFNWVFTDTKGGLVRPQNMIRRSFKPILKKAGLPDIRFHDLRHTHSTLLLSQGVNPKLVQERLGHSSISITLDIYSHVLPNMQQQVAKKLDSIFS